MQNFWKVEVSWTSLNYYEGHNPVITQSCSRGQGALIAATLVQHAEGQCQEIEAAIALNITALLPKEGRQPILHLLLPSSQVISSFGQKSNIHTVRYLGNVIFSTLVEQET